jgi:hypothetical protein
MKKIKLIICTLIVCMSFAGIAEAKSRGGSFKSGFSSQKRSPAQPVADAKAPEVKTDAKQTDFGSFGAATPKTQANAANTPQTQMSKDLTNTASQSNALKTADARTNTQAPASESGWFRSGNQNAAAKTPNAAQPVNPAAQTDSRGNASQTQTLGNQNASRQSGGLMQGLMWFMVGNSIAQHATAGSGAQANQTPANNAQENTQVSQQMGNADNNSITSDGLTTTQVRAAPAEETESFFLKVVRVLLWVGLISLVIWTFVVAM